MWFRICEKTTKRKYDDQATVTGCEHAWTTVCFNFACTLGCVSNYKQQICSDDINEKRLYLEEENLLHEIPKNNKSILVKIHYINF